MFRQGDGRITRSQSGLGIGLALVRQLVELHDGRVEARSEGVGAGARFVVELPLQRSLARVVDAAPAADQATLRGLRILIVDDTADSLEMLRLLLESEGVQVYQALDAESALKVAEGADLDIIISDISMPVMDGYELLARLRSMPRHLAVPAFALTGFGRDADIARALDAGFTQQLTKPIDFSRLVERIRAAVGR